MKYFVVQTSLRFLFRCGVDNCSFVFRGDIDQFYNYFCSGWFSRIAVISSTVLEATCCDFFLVFRHFKKTSNNLFCVCVFFFNLFGCANDFTKKKVKYAFSPFPSRMNFLEVFCHA